MISWGNNHVVIGEYINAIEDACDVCAAKEKRLYYCEQSYFVLYGMPLAPTKKTYYKSCSHCKARLKLRSTDAMLPAVQRAMPVGFNLRYWWGWLVIAAVAVALWQLVESLDR